MISCLIFCRCRSHDSYLIQLEDTLEILDLSKTASQGTSAANEATETDTETAKNSSEFGSSTEPDVQCDFSINNFDSSLSYANPIEMSTNLLDTSNEHKQAHCERLERFKLPKRLKLSGSRSLGLKAKPPATITSTAIEEALKILHKDVDVEKLVKLSSPKEIASKETQNETVSITDGSPRKTSNCVIIDNQLIQAANSSNAASEFDNETVENFVRDTMLATNETAKLDTETVKNSSEFRPATEPVTRSDLDFSSPTTFANLFDVPTELLNPIKSPQVPLSIFPLTGFSEKLSPLNNLQFFKK